MLFGLPAKYNRAADEVDSSMRGEWAMANSEVGFNEKFLAFLGQPGAAAKLAEAQEKATMDARLDRRRELVARRARLREEAESKLPELRAAAAQADTKTEAARRALAEAIAQQRSAEGEVLKRVHAKLERHRPHRRRAPRRRRPCRRHHEVHRGPGQDVGGGAQSPLPVGGSGPPARSFELAASP